MRLISFLSTYPLVSTILLVSLVVAMSLPLDLRKFAKILTSDAPRAMGRHLFLVMLLGGLFAGGSAYFARGGTVTKGVKLIQFDKINLAGHPVYEEIDVGQYMNVTILAKTTVPENGSATVAIYSDRNDSSGTLYEVKRLESVSSAWSKWEQENPGRHLSLVISPPSQPGAIPATEIIIQAYLSPK